MGSLLSNVLYFTTVSIIIYTAQQIWGASSYCSTTKSCMMFTATRLLHRDAWQATHINHSSLNRVSSRHSGKGRGGGAKWSFCNVRGGGVSHHVDRSEVISNPKGGALRIQGGANAPSCPPPPPLNETLLKLSQK